MEPAHDKSSGWTPSFADFALAAGLLAGVAAEAVSANTGFPAELIPALFLLSLPLAWRRLAPLTVFALVMLGTVGGVSYVTYTGLTCVLVAAYSVGVYSRNRIASLGVLVATAVGIDILFKGSSPPIPGWASAFLILIPVWLAGTVLRLWKERADASAERAARIEREQELATQTAISEERARIARDLHDVVAHNVSVMVIQAGAARQVLTSAPDDARQALLAVESTGREAMSELRGFLGVLSEAGELPSLAPQPGLGGVESLIGRVRGAGLPVELSVQGSPRPLPPGADLTAYRVVQEALTNALKYSGPAPTTVTLDYRDSDLKLEVLDEGGGPSIIPEGSGRGLAGMRERLALYGGRLEAGPRLERGFAVRAWLPLQDQGS